MVEIRGFAKVLLFLSSFSPLWIIFLGNLIIKKGLLIFEIPSNEELKFFLLQWIFLFTFLISLISTGLFLREIKQGGNPRTITIKSRENITGEYVLYIVTYIIPFLVNTFETEQIFTLSVMLLFIGILYIRANLVHVNPMFAIFKYRLFVITDERSNRIHLLSKRSLFRNDEVKIGMIDSGFYAEIQN